MLGHRRGSLPKIIESKHSSLPAYTPNAEEENKYNKYYRDSNRFLRDRYFEDLAIAWGEASISDRTENESEKESKRDTPPRHFTDIEDAARIITEAWLSQQQRIKEMQEELSTSQRDHPGAQSRIEKIEKSRVWRLIALVRGLMKRH